jgi:hypothetical protein
MATSTGPSRVNRGASVGQTRPHECRSAVGWRIKTPRMCAGQRRWSGALNCAIPRNAGRTPAQTTESKRSIARLSCVRDFLLEQYADENPRKNGGERGLKYGFHRSDSTNLPATALSALRPEACEHPPIFFVCAPSLDWSRVRISGPFVLESGGEGEIRTHEPREGSPVFKTGAFNRSATSPAVRIAGASYCKASARSSRKARPSANGPSFALCQTLSAPPMYDRRRLGTVTEPSAF